MHADLIDQLLEPAHGSGLRGNRCWGVVIGIVTNNRDPDGLHRVKLRFPWLGAEDESNWARVATPMAGPGRGFYALPEVDDEVLVAFDHGNVDHPYVVGSLWNGQDAPPEDNGNGSATVAMRKLSHAPRSWPTSSFPAPARSSMRGLRPNVPMRTSGQPFPPIVLFAFIVGISSGLWPVTRSMSAARSRAARSTTLKSSIA